MQEFTVLLKKAISFLCSKRSECSPVFSAPSVPPSTIRVLCRTRNRRNLFQLQNNMNPGSTRGKRFVVTQRSSLTRFRGFVPQLLFVAAKVLLVAKLLCQIHAKCAPGKLNFCLLSCSSSSQCSQLALQLCSMPPPSAFWQH